ncbi:MAG: hypothetical protein QM753_05915 [Thermomicrobiales bacterium]
MHEEGSHKVDRKLTQDGSCSTERDNQREVGSTHGVSRDLGIAELLDSVGYDGLAFARTVLDRSGTDGGDDSIGDEHMVAAAGDAKPIIIHPQRLADEAPNINARLAEARPAGEFRWVKLVGSFTISQPIVVGSNTFLDMRRATIRLWDGSNTNMIQSQAAYGRGRDRQIFIRLGRMIYGKQDRAQGKDAHPVIMRKVDGLWIHGGSFRVWDRRMDSYNSEANHAIYVQNCDGFDITNVRMESSLFDGVHIQGPARRGYISGVDVLGRGDRFTIEFIEDSTDLWGDEGDISEIAIAHEPLQDFSHTSIKLLGSRETAIWGLSVRDFSHEWIRRSARIK